MTVQVAPAVASEANTSHERHLHAYTIPTAVQDHFDCNTIAAKFLALPAYEPTVVWPREPSSTSGLLRKTLQSDSTIPHWVTLRTKQRRVIPSQQITGDDSPLEQSGPDIISLIHLAGPDVCSFPDTAHGGLISTLFDEVSLATLCHALDTYAGSKEKPLTFFTAQLNVKFKRPVRVPGTVFLRSWCVAMTDRKCWTRTELLQEPALDPAQPEKNNEDGVGDPMARLHGMATCEAFWLRPQGAKI